MNGSNVSPQSQSHFSPRWAKESNLQRHSLPVFESFCECDLSLGTATSSPAAWHRVMLQPRSGHLGWSWSNSPVISRCPLAQSFCTLNGSALTIKWAWPLPRKAFNTITCGELKHHRFAGVSKVLWRGSHLQVRVKEAVRCIQPYKIPEPQKNHTHIWSLTFPHLFYKK